MKNTVEPCTHRHCSSERQFIGPHHDVNVPKPPPRTVPVSEATKLRQAYERQQEIAQRAAEGYQP